MLFVLKTFIMVTAFLWISVSPVFAVDFHTLKGEKGKAVGVVGVHYSAIMHLARFSFDIKSLYPVLKLWTLNAMLNCLAI